MDKISELRKILGNYFPWHKSRLDCFLQIVLSLFTVCTVNCRELAVGMVGSAKIESRYRRIKAFFTDFTINFDQVAQCLLSQFVVDTTQRVYLTMDRTNWYFGKQKINAFVLAIAHEGVAIPIYWTLLDKAGSSTAQEQIELIQCFINTFGTSCIQGLLADREFANKKLFRWLIKSKIPFYIRIKENAQVRIFKKSKHTNLKNVFRKVNNKSQNYYPYRIFVYGVKVFVAAGRSEKGELLIVVTNDDPKNAVPIYLRRWEIESLFQAIKGRGFKFEDTHLTDSNKLKKLIAVLALGVAVSIKVGEWRNQLSPIRYNQHHDTLRPQFTFFRYGLDYIRDILLTPRKMIRKFRQCLRVIRQKPVDYYNYFLEREACS